MALCPSTRARTTSAPISGRRSRSSRRSSSSAGKKGRSGPSYHIPKEEAPQVVLIGTPNVGKSQIVAATTNATPEVANYPFTTRAAAAGDDALSGHLHPARRHPAALARPHRHVGPGDHPERRRRAPGRRRLAADDCVDSFLFVRKTLAEKDIRLSPVHDPRRQSCRGTSSPRSHRGEQDRQPEGRGEPRVPQGGRGRRVRDLSDLRGDSARASPSMKSAALRVPRRRAHLQQDARARTRT